jgi:hypothetical protein
VLHAHVDALPHDPGVHLRSCAPNGSHQMLRPTTGHLPPRYSSGCVISLHGCSRARQVLPMR